MVQATVNRPGVIGMAAVDEIGDHGGGGPATGAFEPHHDYIGNSPEQVQGIAEAVLVDDHATARAAFEAGLQPDAFNILDNIQDLPLVNLVVPTDFLGCLLKILLPCYTIYGHEFA